MKKRDAIKTIQGAFTINGKVAFPQNMPRKILLQKVLELKAAAVILKAHARAIEKYANSRS